MAESSQELLERMAVSGIITRDDFERVYATAMRKGDWPGSSEGLAEQLRSQGLVTPHQAKAIARGRIEDLKFGPYVVLEQIGQGGMGCVYKAKHSIMERIVALKTIRSDWFDSEEAVGRFLREARTLGRLSHRNVVTAEFADRSGDDYYLVMEFVEGETLYQLVKDNPRKLSLSRVCSYVIQAAQGLGHAHRRGVIHRDIKPENLMLSKTGVIKVLDLGLARSAHEGQSMTGVGASMGTPDFMSPEQCEDSRHADARSDIYSLGCTLYFLCAGRPPFADRAGMVSKFMAHVNEPPPSLKASRSEIPRRLDAIFTKMAAKRPEDRFQSMDEVAEALKALSKSKTADSGSSSGSGFISGSGSGSDAAGVPAPPFETPQISSRKPMSNRDSKRPKAPKSSARPTPMPKPLPWHEREQEHEPDQDETDSADYIEYDEEAPKQLRLVDALLIMGISTVCVVVLTLAWVIGNHLNWGSKSGFAGSLPGETWKANSLEMEFIWCPPGRFRMGSPNNEPDRYDDEDQVDVELTQGFWIGKLEATQDEWTRVMGSNPSRFAVPEKSEDKNAEADPEKPRFPVENVSWNDATEFCRKWTERDHQSGRLPMGWEYHLPTEAQWEYACRAGTTTPTAFGDQLGSDQANFEGDSPYNGAEKGPDVGRTTAVGSYKPNPWGLCDMHGNVWEWCSDWYAESLSGGANPMGPQSGEYRIVRGGCWNYGSRHCRSASRNYSTPEHRDDLRGFRVAIVPVLAPASATKSD